MATPLPRVKVRVVLGGKRQNCEVMLLEESKEQLGTLKFRPAGLDTNALKPPAAGPITAG